jgi:uncharacterized damage-inducible protein DinB
MNPTRTYEYLVKARAHVFGWARPLSPEQYRSEHPIGLGSLARTLHHMMAAEWCYMQRIIGLTDPLGPLPPEHDPETTTHTALPFDQIQQLWTVQAGQIRAELARTRDWSTELTCTTIFEGRDYVYRASPADCFTQLAFHEIHHRTQALHMLRRLGVETGEIDYNTLMFTVIDGMP